MYIKRGEKIPIIEIGENQSTQEIEEFIYGPHDKAYLKIHFNPLIK